MSNNEIKKLKPADIESLFDCSNLVFMANNSLAAIEFLKKITCQGRPETVFYSAV